VDIVPVGQKGHGKRSQHFLSRNLWAIKGFNIPQYKFSSHTSTQMILAKMNPGDWTFLQKTKTEENKRTCAYFSSLLEIVSPNWFKTVVIVHQVMAWARALPVPPCTTVATEANDCPRAT